MSNQPMSRRTDLYHPDDLVRPSVGEFRNVEDIKNFYNRSGAVSLPPGIPRVPTVKSCYKVYAAKKQDLNMVDIIKACAQESKITYNWRYQKRGTCVGQAASTAAEIVMAVAWLVFDKKFPGRAAVATNYAGSRVEVGGQPGSWDGSNGSWVAEFVSRWGVALLSELGLGDEELDADERLAVQWTASRSGVPDKFEKIARDRPIVNTPLVTEEDELIACMESGNPIVDCSNLIPIDRDTDSTVPVQRSGGHATVFGGIRWVKDTCDILYINSWSEQWGRGGCVWITLKDAMRILAQGDSYAFIGIQGLAPEVPLL